MSQNVSSPSIENDSQPSRGICGIARPVSGLGDLYPQSHWVEVHDIVKVSVERAGFDLRLVSEGGGSSIIVSEIIDHLYNDPLVIIDVSSRNPNVMFELGMRVTFEKPVIIIKDDKTDFSFDITPIRHIEYHRELRHSKVISFQEELYNTIMATMEASKDESYKHYLRQFGPVQITRLDTRQLSIDDFAQEMQEMRRDISSLVQTAAKNQKSRQYRYASAVADKYVPDQSEAMSIPIRLYFEIDAKLSGRVVDKLNKTPQVDVEIIGVDGDRGLIRVSFPSDNQFIMREYILALVKGVDATATITNYLSKDDYK